MQNHCERAKLGKHMFNLTINTVTIDGLKSVEAKSSVAAFTNMDWL